MRPQLLFILVMSSCCVMAQDLVKLYVADLYGKPVAFALVRTNQTALSCNNAGVLVLRVQRGASISVHKFGFADTSITVLPDEMQNDTVHLRVRLRLRPAVLPEVSVVAGSLQEINPAEADFIRDYELYQDDIIELLDNGTVLLINGNGQIISRSPKFKGAEAIVKDAYGQLYLKNKTRAWLLKISGQPARFDTLSADLNQLLWKTQYCHAATPHRHYISRYKDRNQTVAFFSVSRYDQNEAGLLREITDDERKKSVLLYAAEATAFNQMVADLGINIMSASNEAELKLARTALHMSNMLELHYSLPSYNYLCQVKDQVYLFAHDIDSMLVFDENDRVAGACRISYHHLKNWDKELLADEDHTRVFARLTRDGHPELVQLNLQDGTCYPFSTAIQARFPDKIRVKGNRLFYLAKTQTGPGLTVYSQQLSTDQ